MEQEHWKVNQWGRDAAMPCHAEPDDKSSLAVLWPGTALAGPAGWACWLGGSGRPSPVCALELGGTRTDQYRPGNMERATCGQEKAGDQSGV